MSFNPYFPVHNYPYGTQPEFAPSWLLGEYNRLVTFINETLETVVLPTASDITYDDGVAHLGETTVQGAIEKLKNLIDNIDLSVTAHDVEFNNSGTTLSSNDVQNAILELLNLIENIPSGVDASDVSYDNSQSGMTADNVQEAIDELKDTIDNLPSGSGLEVIDVSAITPGTYSHEDSENMPIMQKLIDAYTNGEAIMIKTLSGDMAIVTNMVTRGAGNANLIVNFASVGDLGIIYTYFFNVRNYANSETRFIQYFNNMPVRAMQNETLPTLTYPNSYSNADIMADPDLDMFVKGCLMYNNEDHIARYVDTNGTYWNIESISVVGTDKTVKLATLAGGNIHILTFVVHNFEDFNSVSLDTSETTI